MGRTTLRTSALILSLSYVLLGQRIPGSAEGHVASVDGTNLAGATVVMIDVGTDVRNTTTTDNRGEWRFASLPVNPYRLEVELDGFVSVERNTSVRGGETRSLVTLMTPLEVSDEALRNTTTPLIAGAQNSASNWPGFTPQGGVSAGLLVCVGVHAAPVGVPHGARGGDLPRVYADDNGDDDADGGDGWGRQHGDVSDEVD